MTASTLQDNPSQERSEKSISLSMMLDAKEDHATQLLDSTYVEESAASTDSPAEGFCIECEDQPAELDCTACNDSFCQVCFDSLHRRGSRKQHATIRLTPIRQRKPQPNISAAEKVMNENAMDDSDDEVQISEYPSPDRISTNGEPAGDTFAERAKFIPLRFTTRERKYLRLLEAALSVSEYTDHIDIIGHGYSKAKRIVHQIKELCAILSGLVLSADYNEGQKLFQDRDFEKNAGFFARIFELGRRHKIMNPDKMRSTYGKLMYLLQDAQSPEVMDLLGFSCVAPLVTVHSVLEEHNCLGLLQDKLLENATKEIYDAGRSRREIDRDIKSKERSIEVLASAFGKGPDFDKEAVRQCLYSIGDHSAFIRTNRDPCDRMIEWLKTYFSSVDPNKGCSLAIRANKGGARLSHDHAKQYSYVLQSLTLWREILHDMFRLWTLAEQDLLSTHVRYRLVNTGQGLNRVQPAPKTLRMMHTILDTAHKKVGHWVGSSVIHMGDHNVPNSFMFLDKYSQIYRILLPICSLIDRIPNLSKDPQLKNYVTTEYGTEKGLIVEILADFFKHGFDGSGADNFFDAGSCIDGRLTSAWNWCSKLEKKRFYPIFLLCGFAGFDGAF